MAAKMQLIMLPVALCLVLAYAVQGEPCRKLIDDGFFGQGTNDRPAPYSQGGGPYTMIDADGAAELPTGYIYRIDWYQSFPGNFTFQIFRPVDPQNGVYFITFQQEMTTKALGEIGEVTLDELIAVEEKDHFGFTYRGEGSVPINYRLGSPRPGNSEPAPQKPYEARQCPSDNPGCGDVPTNRLVFFDPNPVYKQFQLRAAVRVYRYTEDCEGPPGIVTPSPTSSAITTTYAGSSTTYSVTVCATQCPVESQDTQDRRKREADEHESFLGNKQKYMNMVLMGWMTVVSCAVGLHILYSCRIATRVNKQTAYM